MRTQDSAEETQAAAAPATGFHPTGETDSDPDCIGVGDGGRDRIYPINSAFGHFSAARRTHALKV
jgi:hypothetical protein